MDNSNSSSNSNNNNDLNDDEDGSYVPSSSSSSPSAAQIFSAIADEHSIAILKMAYEGLKVRPYVYDKLTEKSFRFRLRRLIAAGLVEKVDKRIYFSTALGTIIVNDYLRKMDHLSAHFWYLKAIDVLRSRTDVPAFEKKQIRDKILADCRLTDLYYTESQITGYSVIRDYRELGEEVHKLLWMAEKEVYLASKYHDPNLSRLLFKKILEGVKIHLLDGVSDQQSMEKRLDAIVRTPPNEQTAKMIADILASPNFDLRRQEHLETSFMVVDGRTVCFEISNFANPEEFMQALTHYNDPDLAVRLIECFNNFAKSAPVPEIVVKARTTTTPK